MLPLKVLPPDNILAALTYPVPPRVLSPGTEPGKGIAPADKGRGYPNARGSSFGGMGRATR
jgi:hypothetical protein